MGPFPTPDTLPSQTPRLQHPHRAKLWPPVLGRAWAAWESKRGLRNEWARAGGSIGLGAQAMKGTPSFALSSLGPYLLMRQQPAPCTSNPTGAVAPQGQGISGWQGHHTVMPGDLSCQLCSTLLGSSVHHSAQPGFPAVELSGRGLPSASVTGWRKAPDHYGQGRDSAPHPAIGPASSLHTCCVLCPPLHSGSSRSVTAPACDPPQPQRWRPRPLLCTH